MHFIYNILTYFNFVGMVKFCILVFFEYTLVFNDLDV